MEVIATVLDIYSERARKAKRAAAKAADPPEAKPKTTKG